MKRTLLAASLVALTFAAFAEVPISALPAGAALTGTEEVPAVQSGVTVKTTPVAVADYMHGLSNTWTAPNVFTSTSTAASPSLQIGGTNPQLDFRISSGGVDSKRYNIVSSVSEFKLRHLPDAGDVGKDIFHVVNNLNAITSLTFGNTTDNPPFIWAGTGPWTVGGSTGTNGQVLTSTGNATAPIWQDAGGGTIVSGTYAAVCAADTNVASTSCTTARYSRQGSIVTASFTIQIDPTTTGSTRSTVTLPVASNFNDDNRAAGTCSPGDAAERSASVQSDAAGDRFFVSFNALLTINVVWTCIAQYTII